MRILVIDDEAAIRMLVADVLERHLLEHHLQERILLLGEEHLHQRLQQPRERQQLRPTSLREF